MVTRPLQRAAHLASLIEAAGGLVHRYPAMCIAPPADEALARERLGRLHEYDLVIFVSPTAVERAYDLLERRPTEFAAAAVGAGTRAALEAEGLPHVLAPSDGADSEALLALPALADMRDQRVLIVRGSGGRELLARTLRERGADVHYAECYRRLPPAPPGADLRSALAEGRIAAITVSSTLAVENLFAAFAAPEAARLRDTPLFVPHERVAQAATAKGARIVLVCGPTDQEVLERLMAYFKEP